MSRLVSSELLKLRTTRTARVFFVSALAFSVLNLVPTLATVEITDERESLVLLSAGRVWGLFILILAIVGATGEYRHGTITPTVLAMPVREPVVAAKGIAYALAGGAITLVIDAVAMAIALPWLAAKGAPLPSAGELAAVVAGGVAYGMLTGAFGVGVGTLLRNQVAAVVVALVALLMVEPAVAGLAPDVGRYLPQAAAASLLSGGEGAGLALGSALALYLGYAALLLVAGMLAERSRDIT